MFPSLDIAVQDRWLVRLSHEARRGSSITYLSRFTLRASTDTLASRSVLRLKPYHVATLLFALNGCCARSVSPAASTSESRLVDPMFDVMVSKRQRRLCLSGCVWKDGYSSLDKWTEDNTLDFDDEAQLCAMRLFFESALVASFGFVYMSS